MTEESTILESIPLSSESDQPKAAQEEDQSDRALDKASTSTIESLQSLTSTVESVCELAETHLRSQFVSRFLQLINEAEFEFGFSTPADKYIYDALDTYGTFVREWINALFLESFDNPFVLSAILRVLAHFDYVQIYPQGITMALTATGHADIEVRECGIRCFESWQDPESLKILRHLSFHEDWLSEYLTNVISDLEGLKKKNVVCG
jgi:hypothetical protein